MKFIQTINSSANKFAKGMVGIFAIKLMLFGGAFLIQSCQTDEIEDTQTIEQEFALLKFEGIVRSSIPRIQSVVEKQQSFTTNSMTTLSIETQQQNEDEIVESLKPLVEGTKELLLAYDIGSNELSEDFEDLNDPKIALVGLFALALESEESNETVMNFTSAFIPSAYAADPPSTAVQCAVEAIGLDIIYAVVSEGFEKAAKKGLKKAIRKVAEKFLGPVGIGIAVAEFAWCMYTN